MSIIDKPTEAVLKDLYDKFATNPEFSISSPDYQQNQIDVLVKAGLLKKLDATTLSGWMYIVSSTYEGETYFEQQKSAKAAKAWHVILDSFKWLVSRVISFLALTISFV